MSETSGIQWTDATWNTVAGCSLASPGCTNCYAMLLAGTRLAKHPMYGPTTTMVKGRPVFNGTLTAAPAGHKVWTWPLHWRGAKEPRRGAGARSLVFVGDMSDLFHENRERWAIDRTFVVMALADHLDFQVLTKRTLVMREYLRALPERASEAVDAADDIVGLERERVMELLQRPLPNVWVGTSIENQTWANERLPILLTIDAPVRFVSFEPLLGDIDLSSVFPDHTGSMNALTGEAYHLLGMRHKVRPLDWAITGGESGPHSRESVIGHQRSIIRQCEGAGIAAFEKQLGNRPVNREGLKHKLQVGSKGGDLLDMPEDMRVRQFPIPVQVAA